MPELSVREITACMPIGGYLRAGSAVVVAGRNGRSGFAGQWA